MRRLGDIQCSPVTGSSSEVIRADYWHKSPLLTRLASDYSYSYGTSVATPGASKGLPKTLTDDKDKVWTGNARV